jgi:hypothetical protein
LPEGEWCVCVCVCRGCAAVQEIADWLDKLGLGCGLAMARIALGEPASASFAIRP